MYISLHKMLYAIIILLLCVQTVAFPKLPVNTVVVTRMHILPTQTMITLFGTDLEGIVTSKAFLSSLISNLRNEFTSDRLFMQLYYPHPELFIYVSISLVFLYGQWKFYQGSQGLEKFQRMEGFIKREKLIKNIIFILLFVFTKDVMSAT